MSASNSTWLAGCLALGAAASAAGAPAIPASIAGPNCSHVAVELIKQDRLPALEKNRVTTHAALPSGVAALVIVEERGVDLRIEVATGKSAPVGSDNPVRRWASQRVLIEAGPARPLAITIMGKERVSGEAIVSVYSWRTAAGNGSCLRALRLLAQADAHFDEAQGTTLGRQSTESGRSAMEYRAAAAAYGDAAKLLATRPANFAQAHATLSRAEVFYQGLDTYSDARAAGALAVEEFKAAGDAYGQDRARGLVALAGIDLALASGADRAPAMMNAVREDFVALAASHVARGETFEAAQALNNAGVISHYNREYEAALGFYNRAFSLYEKLGEAIRRTQVRQNIALTHQELVRPRLARTGFLQALAELRQEDNPRLYADMLNNLALAESRLGLPDDALQHYSQALEIFTRIQVAREQARSLQGIGTTYFELGNGAVALEYFLRALALRPRELDASGRVSTLRAIANAERQAGRWEEVVRRREEALALAPTAQIVARVRVELARDLTQSGDLERAAAEIERVFATSFGSDRIAHAGALLARAHLSLARRDFAAADRHALEAAGMFAALDLRASRFEASMLRLRAVCARKDRALAQRIAGETVALTEDLSAVSDNPMLRASSWMPLRAAFDFRIRLASEADACGQPGPVDARLALSLSERARNRALADFRRISAARTRGASTDLDRKRNELLDQLAELRAEIEVMGKRDRLDMSRLEGRRSELAELQRQIDILDAQIGGSQAARSRPRSLDSAIERIPADTAVVEYWLGDSSSYAWLVTKGKVQLITLGETARIDAAARATHATMRALTTSTPDDRRRASRALHALIIAPLRGELRGFRNLYFIPDGTLHGVPFAALSDGTDASGAYLVDRHDVGIAASILSIGDGFESTRLARNVRALIVADPVYATDDSRLGVQSSTPPAAASESKGARSLRAGERGGSWARLPASGREAATIGAILGAGNIELLTGLDANRGNLLDRDLGGFQVLHFATHALADMQAPQLSSLILSTVDAHGAARPGEVFAGDLLYRRFDADLVVFSGCDTALGQAAAGEGLLGLRYAAHAAGGRAVVASLWPVVDTVGEELMKDFYVAMVRERRDPVAALSVAMRAVRKVRSDPALWSVFVISRAERAGTIH